MAEVTVPKEDRPSITKYVVLTVAGLGVVNLFVSSFAQDASSAVFLFAVVLVAVVLDVAILFVMVQSLIEEWFQVATIAEE
jgi:hypothetical protein